MLYKANKAEEWYNGVVAQHDANLQSEPYLIQFDDGDEEKGRIGVATFLTLKRERTYKWLDDVDITRPKAHQGATEHSSDQPEERDKQKSLSQVPAVSGEQRQPTEKRYHLCDRCPKLPSLRRISNCNRSELTCSSTIASAICSLWPVISNCKKSASGFVSIGEEDDLESSLHLQQLSQQTSFLRQRQAQLPMSR